MDGLIAYLLSKKYSDKLLTDINFVNSAISDYLDKHIEEISLDQYWGKAELEIATDEEFQSFIKSECDY